MRRSIALSGAALVLFAALSPAVRAATPEDPWESMNRRNWRLYEKVDKGLVLPIARIYHALTPGFIGKGIHNLVVELSEPMTFINDVLQARPKRASKTAARFAVNALAGVGGLIDVAGKGGMPHRDNDFGITLGVWGFKSGPYIFGFTGPSTVRDTAGTIIEAVLDPLRFVSYRSRTKIDLTLAGVEGLDTRYNAEADLQALLADSADPYATLRSAYLQNRQANVEDREAPPANLPDIESAPETPAPPAEGQPPGAESASPPAGQPAAEAPPAEPAPAPQVQASLDEDGPMVTAGADTRREAAL